MTEFWALVLFGTIISIVICIVLAVLYCGCALLCSKTPLAEKENVEETIGENII
jgi:hypothetical protein